jgi:hypothetical protein
LAVSSEHGNKASGSTKDAKYLENLSDKLLLKNY